MKLSFPLSLLLLAALAVAPLVSASAQDYDRPPAALGDDQGGGQYGAPPDSDPGGLSVRVGKLESRIRDMTGQIEELQNANRKLVEQLQKFQADVDSRISTGSGRSKRTDASVPPVVAGGDAAIPDAGPAPRATKARRDDAYDPASASSTDPGRPRPLGTTTPGQTATIQPDDGDAAPMDLSGGKLRRTDPSAVPDTQAPTLRLPPATPNVTQSGTIIASTGPVSPRAAFDLALGFYKGKQYEDAEKGFTDFIQKNPKSRLVADATYYLGESYAQRGRSREAAEQYLKVSTDYASSTRAPDAMLHLGMSLKALGAKEQACATFIEINRKYPNAPSYVKSGVERETKRAQC
jgi:tol-pal system protein YbgF